MNPADLRQQYGRGTLEALELVDDPIDQFRRWFADAGAAGVLEPNAMTLATASAAGVPSARMVLLKGVSAAGFAFFTDYRSRKAQELEENPFAALVFHWEVLERQVRVVGRVARVAPAETAEYYHSRPTGSQLGAWASEQSAPLADRAILESRVAELAERHQMGQIPVPPHWGGYRLTPVEIEFWQGRADRLHDRFRYLHTPEQGWSRVRLSP